LGGEAGMTWRTVAATILIVLLLAGCGAQPAREQAQPGQAASPAAASVTSRGSDTAPQKTPRRIVSLVPAVTEMLYAIGAGPRMVGVSSFDTYPPEVKALPKVGGLIDPDLERIIMLKPDLVVISETHIELGAQLRSAGLATFSYALGDLANVSRTIRLLGTVTGLESEAAAVIAGLESRFEAVRERVKDRPKVRALLVFSRQPESLREIYASGGTGFLHDLLELAGGENVFASVKREAVQVTTEAILSAAPDAIIELRPGAPLSTGEIERERRSWNALAAVPAVRAGRVSVLVGDELVVPGARVADTAERLARALHPESFAK
jgi:iron complex transport system substrate-binding protein